MGSTNITIEDIKIFQGKFKKHQEAFIKKHEEMF